MGKLKTCFGISSECKDGKHILFFDYDKKDLSDIKKEIKILQSFFSLSNVYILTTENGYNAFCLDKFSFRDLLAIYDSSDLICKDFIKYCIKRGHFTLRMAYCKHLIFIVSSGNNIHIKSNGHKIFFNEIMDYCIYDNDNFDNSISIIIESFNSIKHGVYLNER